jgi:hypothetical protein
MVIFNQLKTTFEHLKESYPASSALTAASDKLAAVASTYDELVSAIKVWDKTKLMCREQADPDANIRDVSSNQDALIERYFSLLFKDLDSAKPTGDAKAELKRLKKVEAIRIEYQKNLTEMIQIDKEQAEVLEELEEDIQDVLCGKGEERGSDVSSLREIVVAFLSGLKLNSPTEENLKTPEDMQKACKQIKEAIKADVDSRLDRIKVYYAALTNEVHDLSELLAAMPMYAKKDDPVVKKCLDSAKEDLDMLKNLTPG